MGERGEIIGVVCIDGLCMFVMRIGLGFNNENGFIGVTVSLVCVSI